MAFATACFLGLLKYCILGGRCMIYTVTLNPALDYVLHIQKLNVGESQHSTSEEIYCGGKGINVSTVLKELGLDSVALGFIAGFTGAALQNKLNEQQIKTDFIKLNNGLTRLNVKIKAEEETDIDNFGPKIDDYSLEKLHKKLEYIEDGDILVLAGSVPKSLPEDIYESFIRRVCEKKIKIVVDTTGNLLLNVLKYRPFLVKPNNFELSEIVGKELRTIDEIAEGARVLKKLGAVNVLVSMAEKGALLLDENGKQHLIDAPKGKLINSVGAGDSMVAGFIAGYLSKGNYEYALKLGTACGTASAFSLGLADKKKIEEVLNNL